MDETRAWLAALGVLTAGEAASFTQPEIDRAAQAVYGMFPPGWRPWAGVSPYRPFYARRPRTSPAWVVWGPSLADVAALAWQRERGRLSTV